MRGLWLSVVVVVLVCAVPVWGQQDVVFYDDLESGDSAGWWAPARVGKTGQTSCYDPTGGSAATVTCSGTGQNGDLRSGVAWPNPRFVDNGDGTVVDMLTGLVWLKDADCYAHRTWANALAEANTLASSACGLTDDSVAGDWRLPSRFELESLLDLEYYAPALSNAAGTAKWAGGDPFSRVRLGQYWSSTSAASDPRFAFYLGLYLGDVYAHLKTNTCHIWPVRGGQ